LFEAVGAALEEAHAAEESSPAEKRGSATNIFFFALLFLIALLDHSVARND